MEQTRSNTRGPLIGNKLHPHQTPSPTVGDSDSRLSRPQEDNAGPPTSGTSRLVTTARLLRTTLSLSTPLGTSPVPSPVSSSVPTIQNAIMNIRRKHYHDNSARAIPTLSNSCQRRSPGSSPVKVFS